MNKHISRKKPKQQVDTWINVKNVGPVAISKYIEVAALPSEMMQYKNSMHQMACIDLGVIILSSERI